MDELHRVKDAYAAKFNCDLDRMVSDLQHKEALEAHKGRKFVTFPARRCRNEFPYTPLEEETPLSAPPIGTLPLTSDSASSAPSS